MDEVRNQQRNLAVAFYDYKKAYDMVRHDWRSRESSKCYRETNGKMEDQTEGN